MRHSNPIASGCIAALIVSFSAQSAEPILPEFEAANFAEPKANPYFPLKAGVSNRLAGSRVVDGKTVTEFSRLTVQGPGPVILGVATVLMLDEAFEGDRIVERTLDYYAADSDGNVWYFGEDVTNFNYNDSGVLVGFDNKSTWRAGVNDALPGISVSGKPYVGLNLFQEHAPADEAMDYAEILAVDAVITGPAGTFKGVMKTFEGSTVDAELREFKYYAPGVGMIRADEELSKARDNPGIVAELQP